MFTKMSGKKSSELITKLFICSFVGPLMQTVQIALGDNIKIGFVVKVCYYSLNEKVASTTHVPLPLWVFGPLI